MQAINRRGFNTLLSVKNILVLVDTYEIIRNYGHQRWIAGSNKGINGKRIFENDTYL